MNFTAKQRREQLGLYNIAEAARELNLDYDKLYDDVLQQRILPPSNVMFRRPYYTKDDLTKLESIYKTKE